MNIRKVEKHYNKLEDSLINAVKELKSYKKWEVELENAETFLKTL